MKRAVIKKIILSNLNFKKIFFTILIFTIFITTQQLQAKRIIAYPVPLNPKKQNLTINLKESGSTVSNVIIEIFDITGDKVIKKRSNQLPVYWNGKNSKGKVVKPGLYIIKISYKNNNSKEIEEVLRILVKR